MFDIYVGDEPSAETSGDSARSAFADFYRAELAGQVRRAGLMLGSSSSANDVVHDAFVQIYRRWNEIDEPGPYLNRAVLNGCRDAARRRGRDRRLLSQLNERRIEAPPESLADALSTLPFNQRAAVVLRFYVGLSTRDIAEALNCQPGTVGPWITRGLRRLRKEIQP